MLQVLGAYCMGRTAHFAASHGYYVNQFPASAPDTWDANIMYAGALLYLVTAAVGIIGFVFAMVLVLDVDALPSGGLPGGVAVFFGAISWVATWLFWVGYVKVSGRLYVDGREGFKAEFG